MNTKIKIQAWSTTSLPALAASLSIGARQLHTLLIATFFVISMVLAPWGKSYAADTAVKWHPGHYYGLSTSKKNDAKYLDKVYAELATTPTLRGVQIRYRWAELEPTKGDYDFSSIDQRLAELTAQGKRLVIMVKTKSFDPELALIPDYLKAERFEGGAFPFSSGGKSSTGEIKGYNIKLWNNKVRYRLDQLLRALGEHYNLHPYFEGIGLTETAMGKPMEEISQQQIDTFFRNLIYINSKMKEYFPNTMTFQFVNYPRDQLELLIGQLEEMGVALSGPDTRSEEPLLIIKDEPGTPDGVYSYYPKLSGIVPLAPSVMASNYVNTRRDKTGHEPTVSEILAFARDELKANYVFWLRTTEHYPKVLELLSLRDQTKDSAGGLDLTCPSKFPSCVD